MLLLLLIIVQLQIFNVIKKHWRFGTKFLSWDYAWPWKQHLTKQPPLKVHLLHLLVLVLSIVLQMLSCKVAQQVCCQSSTFKTTYARIIDLRIYSPMTTEQTFLMKTVWYCRELQNVDLVWTLFRQLSCAPTLKQPSEAAGTSKNHNLNLNHQNSNWSPQR